MPAIISVRGPPTVESHGDGPEAGGGPEGQCILDAVGGGNGNPVAFADAVGLDQARGHRRHRVDDRPETQLTVGKDQVRAVAEAIGGAHQQLPQIAAALSKDGHDRTQHVFVHQLERRARTKERFSGRLGQTIAIGPLQRHCGISPPPCVSGRHYRAACLTLSGEAEETRVAPPLIHGAREEAMSITTSAPTAVHIGADELPFVDFDGGNKLKVIQVKERRGPLDRGEHLRERLRRPDPSTHRSGVGLHHVRGVEIQGVRLRQSGRVVPLRAGRLRSTPCTASRTRPMCGFTCTA